MHLPRRLNLRWQRQLRRAGCLVLGWAALAGAPAQADQGAQAVNEPARADPAATVDLVLRTPRRFASAGFHVAQAQGFFAAEGLSVRLVDPPAQGTAIDALAVEAPVGVYAVAGPEGVAAALQGQPLVLLAPIYQDADEALFTLMRGSRRSPFDLRLARLGVQLDDPAQLANAAMLRAAFGADAGLRVRPQDADKATLAAGGVDAIGGLASQRLYRTPGADEPDLFALRPRDWGLNAPGDGLYTSTQEVAAHPQRARALLRAVMRGWMHALTDVDSTLDLLASMQPSGGPSRDALAFEAREVAQLIRADRIDLGRQDEAGVRAFARTLTQLGLAEQSSLPSGFFYAADAALAQQPDVPWWRRLEAPAAALLTMAMLSLALHLLQPWLWPKLAAAPLLARHFGTWRLRLVLFGGGLAVAAAVVLQVERTLANSLDQARSSTGDRLAELLHTTESDLHTWAADRTAQLHRTAADPALQSLAQQLVTAAASGKPARPGLVESLLSYLADQVGSVQSEDLFLIAADGTTLAARQQSDIGQTNDIAREHPQLLASAMNGESVFVPPAAASSVRGKAFFLVPVRDRDRRVIAVFTQRRHPEVHLQRMLASARRGRSFEALALDAAGQTIAGPRFTAAASPRSDADKMPAAARDLITRARSAPVPVALQTASAAGMDLQGHRAYHGGQVLARWRWDRELGLGLLVQVDASEAFANHERLARTLWMAVAGSLLLGGTLLLWLLRTGNRAARRLNQALREQAEAVQQLEDSVDEREAAELRQRTVMDNLVDPVITIDEKGIVRSFSLAAERVFGHSADAVIGSNVKLLMPEEVAREHDGYLARYRQGGERRIIGIGREIVAKRADGSLFPAELSVAEVRVRGQRIYTGIVRDISQRREMDDRLREQRDALTAQAHLLARAQALSELGHWEWRSDLGPVVEASAAPLEWSGELNRLIGRAADAPPPTLGDLLAAVPEPDRTRLAEALERARTDAQVELEMKHVLRGANGREHVVKHLAEVTRDQTGVATRIVGTVQDVTEADAAAQALALAKTEADAANRAKSVFLANMSHEIRTPLNAVLGYAQLLERDATLSDDHREVMRTINRSGQHLLQLINDVLDLSKVEAGRMELAPQDCDLGALLNDVMRLFEVAAHDRGLELALVKQPELPPRVHVDARKLRQVLINLIGNAIKSTLEGSVTLEAGVEATRPDGWQLAFAIRDTGPGIEPQDLERIFHAFSQTEVGTTAGGTGLGLTISRRMVELMGGQIGVDSTPGQGSCFRFDIRAGTAGEGPAVGGQALWQAARLAPGQAARPVLVVDDHVVNRDLLRRVLAQWGLDCLEARDGLEAVALCRKQQPSLVLMDVLMPRLDGIEATRQILALPGCESTVILAVTASAMDAQVQAMLEAGARAVLTKPVQMPELAQAIEEHAGLRFEHEAAAPPPEPATPPAEVDDVAWQRLTPALREQIAGAVELGDLALLRELAQQIGKTDRSLGAAVAALVEHFDLDGLRHRIDVDAGSR